MNHTMTFNEVEEIRKFPSPTGVNHYECASPTIQALGGFTDSFRPQQGLTIMNHSLDFLSDSISKGFPSPTGVNHYELCLQMLSQRAHL